MLAYEESIRIPLIVRRPGFAPAGATCDDIVLNVDLAPTILEMAGVPIPADMEGRSAKRLVAGAGVEDWRRSFLYEYFTSGWGVPSLECVRTADGWKYVRFADWEQLYNLHEDPTEVRNLVATAGFADKKGELMAELRRLGAGVRELEGPSAYKRRSGERHVRQ